MALHPSRVRFVELMTELFQLDEAESLDFGLYRVIRRHNREVREFLGEVITVGNEPRLQGGWLDQLLNDAFARTDDETLAELHEKLQEMESQLGLSPRMTADEREAELARLEKTPLAKKAVRDYRTLIEQQRASQTVEWDRDEVLNRLYQFFARHYQDGDFIVERRYGREGSRYIRSTGEDTEFHWATEEMYYVKSGDIFTDYPVRLSSGQRLIFSVAPDTLQETRASLKPSDKAHYVLAELVMAEDGSLKVMLDYLKGGQTETKKNEIVSAIKGRLGGDEAEIKRWLNHFITRNQSDFFIHKRLKEALTEDLDIFIKTEVLDADQLLADGDLPRRMAKVARIARQVGRQIIDFLATLEDFQKQLWEKKKLVFSTRYVITLDRIAKLAGENWLNSQIDAIVVAQKTEWRELGLGEYRHADDCVEEIPGDLATPDRRRWLPLPVDTRNLDDEFKWALLAVVTVETGLDEALDGIAIRSDNWQALNTLQAKYREQVRCVYIDPPYNTNASGIPYKNGYLHASWNALMADRLEQLKNIQSYDSAIFVSIDGQERTNLEHLLDYVFARKNRIEELIWTQSTINSQLPNYATNHEYVEVYAKDKQAVEAIPEMFREPKPGYAEIMELVEKLNHNYPTIKKIEAEIKKLIEDHKIAFEEELASMGLSLNEETKLLDPWKGIIVYKNAEYRTNLGEWVPENRARELKARIWVYQSVAMSSPATKQAPTTKDPEHLNWRFYKPIHPITQRPCPHPKRGWNRPYKRDPDNPDRLSFEDLADDNRVAWGKDETTVPRYKQFLHEVESNIGKSVFHDYADGERQVADMFGSPGLFLAPKHTRFVKRFIMQTTEKKGLVADPFGGSGSTAHAVVEANCHDFGGRKFITVEVNNYFDTLIIPRLKKAGAAVAWKNGKATALDGPGLFLRVQTLEQYEDTLENLDQAQILQTDLDFEDPAFRLRYRLNRDSNTVYCAIDHFRSPWGYQLHRVEGGGDAPQRTIDLVESLIYLLGMQVDRLYREPEGVVITGQDRRQRSITVLFRDGDHENSALWCEQKLNQHEADRVFTNHAAALSFEGCDRFEAIETVFASQFER